MTLNVSYNECLFSDAEFKAFCIGLNAKRICCHQRVYHIICLMIRSKYDSIFLQNELNTPSIKQFFMHYLYIDSLLFF